MASQFIKLPKVGGGGGGSATWGSITGTLSSQSDLQAALNAKQNSLGFTPENVSNKSTNVGLDQASNTKYPSVKAIVDWVVSNFQAYLGFTPENVANKATTFATINDTLYPTVKAVDDQLTLIDTEISNINTALTGKVSITGDTMTGDLTVKTNNSATIVNSVRITNDDDTGGSQFQADTKEGGSLSVGVANTTFSPDGMIDPDSSFVRATNNKLSIIAKDNIKFGIDNVEKASINASGRFTSTQIDAYPLDIIGLTSGTAADSDEIVFYENAKTENRKIKFSGLPISSATQLALDDKANLVGGNNFSGTQNFGDGVVENFSANVVQVTTFPYQFTSADNGKVFRFNSSVADIVKLPNDLPVGFNVAWSQSGAGQLTFSPNSGGTMNNRQSHTKSAGQYAMGSLIVMTNTTGTNAMYNLSGDTAL